MMHQMHEAAKTLERFEKDNDKKELESHKAHHSARRSSNHKEEDHEPSNAKHKKTKEESHEIKAAESTDKEQGQFSELGTSIVEQIAKIGSKIFSLEEDMKHNNGADATATATA